MKHFLEKRDLWGNGTALWILMALVFLAPLAWVSVRTIHLKNNVESWLPDDDPQARILHWYKDEFPTDDRIIVSWDDSALDDPRVLQLEAQLTGTAPGATPMAELKHVATPYDVLKRMGKGGIFDDEALDRLSGVVIGAGPLKLQLKAGRTDLDPISRELQKSITDKFDLNARVTFGPTDETRAVIPKMSDAADAEPVVNLKPYDLAISWPKMHENAGLLEEVRSWAVDQPSVAAAFLQPGAPVAISLSVPKMRSREMRAVQDEITARAEKVGIDPRQLRFGGGTVVAAQLNGNVRKAAWNRDAPLWELHRRSPMLLCGVVGLVLALVMLRSIRWTFLVLFVANYTVFLTVALVPVTNGSMNMVLVVMPPLLSVLTLSAAIHMVNYWKHAAHDNLNTAVVEAWRMAWRPCLLAGATTAVGLLSLASSQLTPVRDFGIYSAVGCAVSLAMVLIALPALLQFFQPNRAPSAAEVEHKHWQSLGHSLSRHWLPVTVLFVAAFIGCAYGLTRFRTETKVVRYFPDHARLVQDYNFLEEHLSGIVPVEVIVRFDAQSVEDLSFYERAENVRQITEKMRAHPEISGALSLADFITIEDPPENSTTFTRIRYNRRAYEMEQRIKNGEIGGAKSLMKQAAVDVTLDKLGNQKIEIQEGDELWRITAQVAVMSEFDYADLTGDRRDPAVTPGDLNEIAQSVLKYTGGGNHVVTGMVPLFLETQQAVLDSLIFSFAAAFVVIGVVMMFLLRHPLSGLITMVPNVLPVGMVFGLISWCGLKVDIGTMISASVALGIAVDGTLHLLSWFQKGIRTGLNRGEAVTRALMHCGPALWQTSAAVGLGLLMLYPAELLLVSRFGWLMASLIGAALVADVVLLPALLAGPLGALIERTIAREQALKEAHASQPEQQVMAGVN